MKDWVICPDAAAPSLETELPSTISLDGAVAWQRRYWRRWNNQRQQDCRWRIRNVERRWKQGPLVRSPGILSLPNRTRLPPIAERIAAFHFRGPCRAG